MKKKLILLFLLCQPMIFGLYQLFIVGTLDPIKYIYSLTGYTALVLLIATTTLSLLTPWIKLLKYRKILGLSSFFYALIHFLNFLVLDMELDARFAFEETLDKPFIYLGVISFLFVVFMAATSTPKLFRRLHKYHTVIYASILLAVVHFIMAQKALSINQWLFLGIFIFILFFKLKQLFYKIY